MSEATTIEVDLTRFNRELSNLSERLGITLKTVLRKEAGELSKTLIKITPPQDVQKTKRSIGDKVRKKFKAASEETNRVSDKFKGNGSGVKWYHVTRDFLYGAKEAFDLRRAGADEIYRAYFSLKRGGTAIVDFKHPRKHQRVKLTGKWLVRKAQVNALARRLQSHIGRLKAGWLVSFDRLNPGGSNQPPTYVTRHRSGARGEFHDNSRDKDFPSMTFRNYAKGVQQRAMRYFVNQAVAIRTKAMMANLKLFLNKTKNLSDYART